MRLPQLSVRPLTLLIAMAAIVALAAAAVWLTLNIEQDSGRIDLAELSADSTATVGLAGVFPAEGDEPLANPLGIASDGELLYVAESDAGRIRIFDLQGGAVGVIGLPEAEGVTSVYPSALALAGDRLAVIDNASARVLVISTQPAEEAEVLLTLGEPSGQPTSVAFDDGEYFVFDAAVGVVDVYDVEGERVRRIADSLEPPLAFASGISVDGSTLIVTDSNGGRVVALNKDSGTQLFVFEDRYALPRGVTALGGKRLAIVDTFERAVHVTDSKGVRLDVISEETVPDAPLSSPRDAAWVNADARLYVTDAAAGRVLVFNIRTES